MKVFKKILTKIYTIIKNIKPILYFISCLNNYFSNIKKYNESSSKKIYIYKISIKVSN